VALLQQSAICHTRVIVTGHCATRLVVVLKTLMVTFVPQHASTAVGGSKVQVVPQITVLLEAQVATGGVESTIVTIWLHGAEVLLQQSVACHLRVTFVVQGGKKLVNVLTTVRMTFVPQQASKTTGSSNVQGVPHSTVLFVAQVSVGGVVSTIVTTSVQVAVLVQQSCACQVMVIV
jgi:hypothetical protein